MSYTVEIQNKTTGEWSDTGERFDTQSQAEQFVIGYPEGYSLRIGRTD